MRRSWEWFTSKAKTKHAAWWLAGLSFSEASFFPIIADVLLVPILAARAGRWRYYAFLTTITSVAGAVFGYIIGMFLFESIAQPIIHFYGLVEEFEHVGTLYSQSTFWAVLTAAITPIPFKVFVLGGGFFNVPFIPFLLGSIIGRSVRFFGVAWIAHRFGPQVAEKYIDHFNFIAIVLVLIAFLAVSVYWDLPEYIW